MKFEQETIQILTDALIILTNLFTLPAACRYYNRSTSWSNVIRKEKTGKHAKRELKQHARAKHNASMESHSKE